MIFSFFIRETGRRGGMLSLQEMWAVAAFIDTQKRPEITGRTSAGEKR